MQECQPLSEDGAPAMTTKSNGVKRRFSDLVRSCLSRGVDSHASPAGSSGEKKLRCCQSWAVRAGRSKVRWEMAERMQQDVSTPTFTKKSDDDAGEQKCSGEKGKKNNDTWYTKEEYKQILLDQCLTVHIMRSLRIIAEKVGTSLDNDDGSDGKGKFREELVKKMAIDPEEYCERGLESYASEEGRNMINLDRKRHKLLVIGEHIRQGKVGAKDPELVRSVSMTQSKKSLVKAQLLAAIDQREARASNNKNEPKEGLPLRPCEQNTSPHTIGVNPIQDNNKKSAHRNTINAVLNPIQDSAVKQLLRQQHLELLLKQQQERNQYHDYTNKNDFLNISNRPSTPIETSTMANPVAAIQEQLLLHSLRQRQQQLRQQQYYQENIHRLLLHQQQQQHLRSLEPAATSLVDHSPR